MHISSCNTTKDEHPEYFSGFYQKINLLAADKKEAGIGMLDNAFNRFKNPGKIDLYNKYNFKRDYYFTSKNFYPAMLQADSMLLVSGSKIPDTAFSRLHALALFHKGDILLAVKNINEAFHYYFLGKQELMNSVSDTCCGMFNFSSRLANINYLQGRYTDAISCYEQAYSELFCCADLFNRFAGQQAYLDNIGLCYSKLNKPDSALHYYQTALNYIRQEEYKFSANKDYSSLAKAVIFDNRADIFFKQEKYSQADELYKHVLRFFDSVNNHPAARAIEIKLAKLYIQSGMLQKADETLQGFKQSLDSLPDTGMLIEWYKLRYEYYNKAGNENLSFQHMRAYTGIKDSLEIQQRLLSGMDVSNEFETVETKARYDTLQRDNEVKTAYLSIIVIAAVMGLAIGMLIWYNLKRSAKHVEELTSLNTQVLQKNEDLQKVLASLEQSNNENKRMMRMVAHDLKNPISAIHNLVHSLLRKKEYPQLIEMFELIRTSCINSMVMINEMLTEKKQPSEHKKEMVNIALLLEYSIELLQANADEKNQKLFLQAEHAMVMLNRKQIWKLVSDLVNNAIKLSPENTVIDIRLEKKDNKVLLSILDNSMNTKKELFTAKENGDGNRLREDDFKEILSASKKIIEEHDGRIWHGLQGHDSIFYVELNQSD